MKPGEVELSQTFLDFLLLPVGTIVQQTTALALGLTWMTDLASVQNQIEVQRKLFAGGNERFDEHVRLRVAAFFGQQFQAA